MKLAFFNFKFGTKTDYWLRELEERGNTQKRTFTILLWIYSVSITVEKSGRHWPMCEYCSHEAAAACINDDIKKVVERLLRDIWVHTPGQESVSGEWQETFSFSQYRQIRNDSGRCPPLFCRIQVRTSSNSETSSNCWALGDAKIPRSSQGIYKDSVSSCFLRGANRLKSRWRSPAYYQSTWGATSDQDGNTRD